VVADAELADSLAAGLQGLRMPVSHGTVWTADTPYRETKEQLARYAKQVVLAVEMQSASPFAFAIARGIPVGMVAHVTNAVDHDRHPFNKGSHASGQQLLERMCWAAKTYLGRTTNATRAADFCE
jgi:uridine phosphorylase